MATQFTVLACIEGAQRTNSDRCPAGTGTAPIDGVFQFSQEEVAVVLQNTASFDPATAGSLFGFFFATALLVYMAGRAVAAIQGVIR